MSISSSRQSVLAVALALATTVSCGGDKPSSPSPTAASIAFVAGGGQTVRIKSAATTNPSAKVLDANAAAVSGVTVTFTVTAGGGSVATASAITGADGIASAGAWTMGQTAVINEVTAAVQGSASMTATLQATARLPRWTYMVYLAADNNLAIAGVGDIDEMEAAGADPEVQVVVQGEFDPREFSLRGCNAACANLPNFNTFRYALTGATPSVTGPNGSVTDIGNRNMTDPNQLKEFINWAKANYPAEKYGLVLWNHGGGYTGLLGDHTSAGSAVMSLEDLKTALTGTGSLELINFDMCLMGAYETLVKVVGLVNVAVFSEETEPGEGDPYQEIVDALQANPTMDGKAFGAAIVDAYHASYNGDPASTTKSAYDVSGYSTFETSLNTLAATLTTNISPLTSAIGGAAAASQKYEMAQLTDLIDFLDSLNVRTADNTVKTQIAAVKAAASASSFRLNTKARNGGRSEANKVTRSTGLHVVMPSKQAFDQLPNNGPASFASYTALYTGKPWTTFLNAWLTGGATTTLKDQGENRYQVYLVWDSLGKSKNVDVDLWVLEPSGNLYIPFLGTVTPNGLLTDDSESNKVPYEGYIQNRFVQFGAYKFYANLYADAQNFQPIYDIMYRVGVTASFTSLYAPTYPKLTTTTSWLNDPTPTFAEIEAGAYTDLKYAAILTISEPPPGLPGSAPPAERSTRVSLNRGSPSDLIDPVALGADNSLTSEQLSTLHRLHVAGKLTAARGMAADWRGNMKTRAPRPAVAPALRSPDKP